MCRATPLEKIPIILSCGHRLCVECYLKWKAEANTCPECRGPIKEVPIPDPLSLIIPDLYEKIGPWVSLVQNSLSSFSRCECHDRLIIYKCEDCPNSRETCIECVSTTHYGCRLKMDETFIPGHLSEKRDKQAEEFLAELKRCVQTCDIYSQLLPGIEGLRSKFVSMFDCFKVLRTAGELFAARKVDVFVLDVEWDKLSQDCNLFQQTYKEAREELREVGQIYEAQVAEVTEVDTLVDSQCDILNEQSTIDEDQTEFQIVGVDSQHVLPGPQSRHPDLFPPSTGHN